MCLCNVDSYGGCKAFTLEDPRIENQGEASETVLKEGKK